MEKRIVIHKKQAAESYQNMFSKGNTIYVDGDLGSDTIPIKHIGADDATLTTAYDSDGNAVELTATNTAIVINGSMHLDISKPSTTNAVAVLVIK